MSSNRELERVIRAHVVDLVAGVTRVIRAGLQADVVRLVGNGVVRARVKPRKVKQRRMVCIAPKCGRRSKGPRFHYLCEKHLSAKPAQYNAWRRAVAGDA